MLSSSQVRLPSISSSLTSVEPTSIGNYQCQSRSKYSSKGANLIAYGMICKSRCKQISLAVRHDCIMTLCIEIISFVWKRSISTKWWNLLKFVRFPGSRLYFSIYLLMNLFWNKWAFIPLEEQTCIESRQILNIIVAK